MSNMVRIWINSEVNLNQINNKVSVSIQIRLISHLQNKTGSNKRYQINSTDREFKMRSFRAMKFMNGMMINKWIGNNRWNRWKKISKFQKARKICIKSSKTRCILEITYKAQQAYEIRCIMVSIIKRLLTLHYYLQPTRCFVQPESLIFRIKTS